MQMAIDGLGSHAAAEADELREAMGSKRSRSAWSASGPGSLRGHGRAGITGEVADGIYASSPPREPGFPESHRSFAYLVYASAWLKRVLPGGVLRGAAQRPAHGLLLAPHPGAGRPLPRRGGCGPTSTRPPPTPPSSPAATRRILEAIAPQPVFGEAPGPCLEFAVDGGAGGRRAPATWGERGRRCASGCPRCATSAPTRLSASPPAAPTPPWRTRPAQRRPLHVLEARPPPAPSGASARPPAGAGRGGGGPDRRRPPRRHRHRRRGPTLPPAHAPGVRPTPTVGHRHRRRRPPHPLRAHDHPTPSGRPRRAPGRRPRRRPGARGRRGHPPPAAGHRLGHHLREPRGRDRPHQRHLPRAAGRATARSFSAAPPCSCAAPWRRSKAWSTWWPTSSSAASRRARALPRLPLTAAPARRLASDPRRWGTIAPWGTTGPSSRAAP